MEAVCEGLNVSERRACKVLGQYRSTQRHVAVFKSDEDALTKAIVELAARYGRYGYKRVTGLLREAGWKVNKKRGERIWRREGLKVPARQPKRGRLWLNDGSCIRLRPERPNHVWSYDFVADRTHEGKAFRGKRYRKETLAVEEKILSLAPDDFPTQVSLVRLLWKTGKRQEMLDRLQRMEEQWARRGNKKNWRKTRLLLCRYSPSLSTGWRCFLSFFMSPYPYRPLKKGYPKHP